MQHSSSLRIDLKNISLVVDLVTSNSKDIESERAAYKAWVNSCSQQTISEKDTSNSFRNSDSTCILSLQNCSPSDELTIKLVYFDESASVVADP